MSHDITRLLLPFSLSCLSMGRMACFLVLVIAVEVVSGWGCGLVLRHLSILCDALGSIPSTEKQKKKSKQSKKKKV